MRLILTLLFILFTQITYAAANKQAMVVTGQSDATKVGVNILKQGGNAIDAAVAIGYAMAVTYPCCGNIGGGGFMLIHLADGKNTFINFREKAPAAIDLKAFFDKQGKLIPEKSTYGYLAVAVPGTVLGLNTALEKYGTMPLNTLIQPAISLAKNGFILKTGDHDMLYSQSRHFKDEANIANTFLNKGKFFNPGELLVQKDLAKTLELIAKEGTKAFYNGPIADTIIQASQKNGGVLSKDDFKNYSITELHPLTCYYRGYQIITTPPPGSGATLCEILNISNGYPLKKWGFHSAPAIHYVVEAMRYAYADRNQYLGDPDFVGMPIQKLISTQYASKIRNNILPNRAGDSSTIGFVSKAHESANTTSYVVIDKQGNAVSVTYTINGNFGAEVIAGDTGFFLNDEIDDFALTNANPNQYQLIQGPPNLLAPNKRPLSSMSPTFVMKDQKLFMILSTPGGSTIPTQLVETIQNVIDYHLPLSTAVNAARFHMQWLPDAIYRESTGFTPETLKQLDKMQHQIRLGSPYHTSTWGKVSAIKIDPKTRTIEGAIDQRAPAGSALGY